MLANINVHEPKPPDDPDSALTFSMEGYPGQPPAPLVPFFWSPGWNSIQAVNKYQEEVNGLLRGGPAGVRMIEPGGGGEYFRDVPAAFAARAGEWLVAPLYHTFGSEELSREAPGIAELAPKPYIALGAEDAARFGAPGTTVEVTVSGAAIGLPLAIRALPRGVAGLPAGVPPLEGMELPAWGRLGR